LIEKYSGKVPDEIDELIKLKGVGRKTANLVVTLGYNKPGICVDTHVHRISNRWGYVKTATPAKTEVALREKLPKQYWIQYNDLLVSFGQQLCRPISPLCSQCPVAKYCNQVGVTTRR
jgi:endonuclease-3